MNTYILVLTLIYKSGSGGMGGLDHIEVKDHADCQRVGSAWVNDIRGKSRIDEKEAFFSCIAK